MADNTCTATTRAGAPCRRKKVHGSDLCQAHGGTKSQVVFDENAFKQRCTANSTRSGERCRKAAIKGGTVCRTHGGNLPAVKKRARERWRDLEEPMVALTERMVERAANGELADGDTLRLLSFLADRMGYQRGVTVEHTQAKPWEVTMQHIVTDLSTETYAAIEDIEDAEVVEESMPPVDDYSLRAHFTGPRIVPDDTGRARVDPGYVPINSAVERPIRRSNRDDD